MRSLVYNLEYSLYQDNSKLNLSISNLRLKHPIFKHLSINAFKYLVENSFLFKLANNQHIYKDKFRSTKNVYFILYGDARFEKPGMGAVGETLTIGSTIGEEVLFIDSEDPLLRKENALSIGDSCLL